MALSECYLTKAIHCTIKLCLCLHMCARVYVCIMRVSAYISMHACTHVFMFAFSYFHGIRMCVRARIRMRHGSQRIIL